MVKTKVSKGKRRAKPEGPGNLAKPYWAIVQAKEDINRELLRMHKAKSRYEKAVEDFFEELEKNPAAYQQRTVKGGKVRTVKLTKKEIRKYRKAFRKGYAAPSTVQFFCDWDNCQCPERSWCVRLNCNPETFNSCCYLCFSTDPIQCLGG